MVRKIIAAGMTFLFLFSTVALAASDAQLTLLNKIVLVESAIYGSDQTGSLLERIGRLERDLYGAESNQAMVSKVETIYGSVFENTLEPSLFMRVNGVEWAITHETTPAPIKERIEKMETMIHGMPVGGSFSERLQTLTSLAFADGVINSVDKVVEPDTLVKISLLTEVDSKVARVGDLVRYVAAEDVVYQGALIVAKGAEGEGRITKVSSAQNFGRDAQVEIDFSSMTALDGTRMETFLGEKAQQETETMAIAAGATVAGLALLGPVGIVTGAFVKGKNVNIPEGTEVYIQTKAENAIHGIQIEFL